MNGKAAFPQSAIGDQGMTLRDYFATRAMQAYLVNNDTGAGYETTAKRAYRQADAMLKERELWENQINEPLTPDRFNTQ